MAFEKKKLEKEAQTEEIRKLLEDSVKEINCIGCTPTQTDCKNCMLTHQVEYLYKHGVRVKTS